MQERSRVEADRLAVRARRRARIASAVAVGAVMVALGVGLLAYWARVQQQSAKAQKLVAYSISALDSDPQQSIELANKALQTKSSTAADSAFRVAVSQSRLRAADAHRSAVSSVSFGGRDGRWLLASTVRAATISDSVTGRRVRTYSVPQQMTRAIWSHGQVVAAAWDGTVRIFDPAGRHSPLSVRASSSALQSAELTPDRSRVLTLDIYGDVHLTHVPASGRSAAREPAGSRRIASDVSVAALSPDGSVVAAGGTDGTVTLYPTGAGAVRYLLGASGLPIDTLVFSRDGKLLVSGGADKTARVWSVGSARQVGPSLRESDDVVAAAFSRDGKFVATAASKFAHVWKVGSGRQVAELRGHTDWVNSVDFRRDGKLLVTADNDGTARVWEVGTATTLLILSGGRGVAEDAVFSPDGRSVATAGDDGTARVWDVDTGREFRGHTNWVLDAVFDPDGKHILTAGADNQIRLWTIADGASVKLNRPPKEPVNSVAFSPDDNLLVMADDDGTATVRKAHSGEFVVRIDEAKRIGSTGHDEASVVHAEFSPDSKRVITASVDWTASVWDAHSGRLIRTLRIPKDVNGEVTQNGAVTTAAYSPDGRYIVTGGTDRLARVWDAHTFRYLKPTFHLHHGTVWSVAFDPKDPRLVVTASDDQTARVWDVATRTQVALLDAHAEPLHDAAFSPDGRLVATAGSNGVVRVWDWSKRELLATMKVDSDLINSIAFSSDGKLLLTASDDRTAKLFSCETCARRIDSIRARVDAIDRNLPRSLRGPGR